MGIYDDLLEQDRQDELNASPRNSAYADLLLQEKEAAKPEQIPLEQIMLEPQRHLIDAAMNFPESAVGVGEELLQSILPCGCGQLKSHRHPANDSMARTECSAGILPEAFN